MGIDPSVEIYDNRKITTVCNNKILYRIVINSNDIYNLFKLGLKPHKLNHDN